jgi:hypothetical protein
MTALTNTRQLTNLRTFPGKTSICHSSIAKSGYFYATKPVGIGTVNCRLTKSDLSRTTVWPKFMAMIVVKNAS